MGYWTSVGMSFDCDFAVEHVLSEVLGVVVIFLCSGSRHIRTDGVFDAHWELPYALGYAMVFFLYDQSMDSPLPRCNEFLEFCIAAYE